MKFVELTNRLDEWDNFVSMIDSASFTQSKQQYQLLVDRITEGVTKIIGVVDDDDVIIMGSIVLIQPVKFGNKINLEYGPVLSNWTNEELINCFFEGVMTFAKKHNGVYLSVSPNTVYQSFNDDGLPISDVDTTVLDVMIKLGYTHEPFEYGMKDCGITAWQYVKNISEFDTMSDIRDSYHKMVKRGLKLQDMGVQVRELKRDELACFKKLWMKQVNDAILIPKISVILKQRMTFLATASNL